MVRKILAALLAAAVIFIAAVDLSLPERRLVPKRSAPPPAAVSMMYREADIIILANCTRVSHPDGGAVRARFTVESSPQGNAAKGTAFSLNTEAAAGQRYLLYLNKLESSGAEPAYELIEGGIMPVTDGVVVFSGEKFTLESVLADIKRQQSILTVPAAEFYYNDFDSLVDACDEIIVGRVLKVSEPQSTVCRSSLKGESTLNTLDEIFMEVRIENPLYTDLAAGETISVVLEPYYVRPVTNAQDLSTKKVPVPPEGTPEAGEVYVFFLMRSADKKSGMYFTVNPYQGYVLLVGNTMIHPYYNEAFERINDLRRFAALLREHRDVKY